ncbi:MAG: histidine kinase dimerization/phospho-acceptor domain-containing protein [bacterium]
MVVKAPDGVCINCNDKFAELFGETKDKIIGKVIYELFDKEIADKIIAKDERIKQEKECNTEEFWIVYPNGKKRYMEHHTVPLVDLENNVVAIFTNIIDRTKKQALKNQLTKAKEAAEKVADMKSNFLANMSHEIRTPLNGVLGFVQLLEDTTLTEDQQDFVAYAQKSSELLLNIINEILDFSKIEAGKLKIDSISFDIRSVVEDITIINIWL